MVESAGIKVHFLNKILLIFVHAYKRHLGRLKAANIIALLHYILAGAVLVHSKREAD